VRWTPTVLCLGLGLVVLAINISPAVTGPQDLLIWLRATAVFGALSLAFLLDDPTEPTTEAVAVPLLYRRALRLALALPPVAVWWALALGFSARRLPRVPIPVAAVTLEAAALTALALALAAGCARWVPEGTGGVAAAPALLMSAVLAAVLPPPSEMFPLVDGPAWTAAHVRWAIVGVAAVVVFIVASRGPGRQRRWALR
jgi:hypothetical protein